MKFLSEEGLDYLVSKFKSLFATESKVEHLKEKVKKMNTPMQTVARKAIRLGSAGKNVRYFHRGLFTPIVLGDIGKVQISYVNNANETIYLQVLASTINNVKSYKDDIYLPTYDDGKKAVWGNFFRLNAVYPKGQFTKVLSIRREQAFGVGTFTHVVLDIQPASNYTGNTASPYLAISNGKLVGSGMMKADSLLFNYNADDDSQKIESVKTFTKYNRNRVYLYVKYYKKRYTDACPVNKDRKYHLVNRTFITKDGNSTKSYALNHKRGDAIIKWYHRGVAIATKHIYYNGKFKKIKK